MLFKLLHFLMIRERVEHISLVSMHFDDHINICFSGSIFHADFKNAKHFSTARTVFFLNVILINFIPISGIKNYWKKKRLAI